MDFTRHLITNLIKDLRMGDDPKASPGQAPVETWNTALYQELRGMAASQLARQPPGQTLQATALVHEAWLRLGADDQHWQTRAHFFGAAAQAMRQILIEQARRIFLSSRSRHTRCSRDWSSDVCSSDLSWRPWAARRSRRPRSSRRSGSRSTIWKRSEERRVGKECRSRWSPYH